MAIKDLYNLSSDKWYSFNSKVNAVNFIAHEL